MVSGLGNGSNSVSSYAFGTGVGMDFSNGYYNAMLDLIDVFFESAVDQQVYEECARYIYGKKAYVIFTIDKLVMLLIRHVSVRGWRIRESEREADTLLAASNYVGCVHKTTGGPLQDVP